MMRDGDEARKGDIERMLRKTLDMRKAKQFERRPQEFKRLVTPLVESDGTRRQRDLDLLDSEIDAFNDLIAAQCGG
jgi:hypothetical protein